MALILATAGLAGVAACATAPVATFHPAGAVSPAPALRPDPASPVAATPAPGQPGFAFPAGFTVTFQPTAWKGAKRRAIVTGYENYVRSFWSAIITRGRDHTYQRYLAGNALTFVRSEIAYYRVHDLTVRGAARYFGIRVTNVYFGRGAVVQACVDVSGLSKVTPATGRRVGGVYSQPYLRYLEQVTEGKWPTGGWYVLHTGNYPATTSEGMACR